MKIRSRRESPLADLTKAYFIIRSSTTQRVSDKEYPRHLKPISSYSEICEKGMTSKDVIDRIIEEMIISGISTKEMEHDQDILRREKEQLERMIQKVSDIYGIQKEDLKDKK